MTFGKTKGFEEINARKRKYTCIIQIDILIYLKKYRLRYLCFLAFHYLLSLEVNEGYYHMA